MNEERYDTANETPEAAGGLSAAMGGWVQESPEVLQARRRNDLYEKELAIRAEALEIERTKIHEIERLTDAVMGLTEKLFHTVR